MLFVLIGCGDKPKASHNTSFTPAEVAVATSKKESNLTSSIAGLSWYAEIDGAFELARKEDKDVLIMVGEEGCRWCKKMKKRTLSDPRIQQKLEKYILVSVRRSDKDAVAKLSEFDGNIPSFFFMKSDGELIEPVVGYFDADDFLQYIEEIEE